MFMIFCRGGHGFEGDHELSLFDPVT